MHKLSQTMPNFWRHATAIALATLVAACGGNVSSGSGVQPLGTTVVLEDAAIVNALVTDAVGRRATVQSRGKYEFLDDEGRSFSPIMPIRVVSSNELVNGVIPEGTIPKTFQDLDGDGVYSRLVDIPFNGTFTVRYAIPGSAVIYANPVVALIPSNWNGTSSIAGLSPALLKASATSSVEKTGSAELKQVTSLLTALSDTLGSTLNSNGMKNDKVSQTLASLFVAVSTTTGVNLLDANAATKLGEVAASTVTGAANSLLPGNLPQTVASATNLGTNLQKLSVNVAGTLKNYEAIVQVAQNSASLSTPNFDVTSATAATTNADLTIQNTGAVAITNTLRLVPFCDLLIGQTGACNPADIQPWLVFDRLSDFKLTTASDESIVVSGAGSFFNGFSFLSGLKAQYQSNSNSWKHTSANASTMEISLRVSFKDPSGAAQTGNLLSVCNAQGNCVPYYLATQSGVCNLVKTNNVVNQDLLSKINALNALKSTCP